MRSQHNMYMDMYTNLQRTHISKIYQTSWIFFNRSDKNNTHFPSCYCFKWAYREVILIPCISLVDLCKCNVEVLKFMFQIK